MNGKEISSIMLECNYISQPGLNDPCYQKAPLTNIADNKRPGFTELAEPIRMYFNNGCHISIIELNHHWFTVFGMSLHWRPNVIFLFLHLFFVWLADNAAIFLW